MHVEKTKTSIKGIHTWLFFIRLFNIASTWNVLESSISFYLIFLNYKYITRKHLTRQWHQWECLMQNMKQLFPQELVHTFKWAHAESMSAQLCECARTNISWVLDRVSMIKLNSSFGKNICIHSNEQRESLIVCIDFFADLQSMIALPNCVCA